MFNKFLDEIIKAENRAQLDDIFYRSDGIDMMYQKDKLTWNQQQRLLNLINKLYKLMEV